MGIIARDVAAGDMPRWHGQIRSLSATNNLQLENERVGVKIEVVQSTLNGDIEGVMCLPQHTIFVTLVNDTTHTETYIEGGPTYRGSDCAGNVSFVPANCKRWGWYSGTHFKWISVLLEPKMMAERLSEVVDITRVEFIPFTNSTEPLLYHLVLALRDAVQDQSMTGTLFVDHVSTTLWLHLVRQYSNLILPSPPKGGLSDCELRRVMTYLDDRLADNVTLAELAGVVQMGEHHFCRSFKKSLGMTPYQYLTKQRIERTKKLLANPALPLSEIALTVGFYDHSHFTNHFRRSTGITPSAYRKALR